MSCGYPPIRVPDIDISQLTLEEVLTHTRIVYQRLAKLQKARDKIKRQLGRLYGRRCKKSPRLKEIANEELTSELYSVRSAIQRYDDLHKRLCRKSKSRVRETVKRLPKTIYVPLAIPPFPTSNRLCSIFPEIEYETNKKFRLSFDLSAVHPPAIFFETEYKLIEEVSMSSIESRPDAPWIKRNKFGVVFTTSEELLKGEDVDIKTERSHEGEGNNNQNDELEFDDE